MVFKGVKLTKEQCEKIQRFADARFNGNFSAALRFILVDAVKVIK